MCWQELLNMAQELPLAPAKPDTLLNSFLAGRSEGVRCVDRPRSMPSQSETNNLVHASFNAANPSSLLVTRLDLGQAT